ncbi:MAG TPA: undecaprenyl diphosphate synthase family protein, partial [Lysobacter sp.]
MPETPDPGAPSPANRPPPAANPGDVPRHVAVIMDGNGRWAARRRRPRAIGHRAGARAVNLCIDYCLERG